MRRFSLEDIARIRLMASCGHAGTAIATALGRTPQAIRVKCVELGIRLRKPRADRVVHVSLAQETMDGLRVFAVQTGTTPTKLMRQIIDTVTRDDLFAAVIDAPPPMKPKPKRIGRRSPPLDIASIEVSSVQLCATLEPPLQLCGVVFAAGADALSPQPTCAQSG